MAYAGAPTIYLLRKLNSQHNILTSVFQMNINIKSAYFRKTTLYREFL
jgi:hypothetical protein